ncbi:MAG TPA: pitrilysin family protein [Blastocatellia bacterium]
MQPSSTQPATRPRLDVERFELANGLVVLLSENHATPAVAFKAVVAAGSRYETDEQAGLASLVGEMIDEGTTTRSAHQIAETVEVVGGKLGTYGDYQESGVVAMFLSQDLALGLEITADLLMNATFPEDKVQQQRDRRLAQLKSRLDVPRTLASDVFNDIVFRGTPQHRPAVGYEATVKHLTRDDMAAFYRRFYAPNNTLLTIVGDIDKATVRAQVEAAFGAWPRASELTIPDVPKPVRQRQAIERFVVVPKEQVNIFIGHSGIERRNPDYYALLVLDTILGSSPGFTSRIPRILRDEMGLAYTTFSNITSSAGIDPGRFVAYIGTSPDNLQLALAGLRNEIERIVKEPVAREEVELAADYLTGSFVFHFQKSLQIADFLADAETYGLGFDYLERYPQLIRAVTVEEVGRVARTYLDPEHLTTVVVGPVTET